MSTEADPAIGLRTWPLADRNTARACESADCEARAWFYIHDVGYHCGEHLPENAVASPHIESADLSQEQRERIDQYLGGGEP